MDLVPGQLQSHPSILVSSTGRSPPTVHHREKASVRPLCEGVSNTKSAAYSSPSSTSAGSVPRSDRPNAEIMTRLLESAEHKALCEVILGSRDVDTKVKAEKYKVFCELAARLEAEEKAATSYHSFPALKSNDVWSSYWW